MTPETKVKNKLKDYFKKNNIFSLAVSDRYHSGYPDFLSIQNGTAVFYECKRQGKDWEPIQKHIGKEMIKNGAKYFIVTLSESQLNFDERTLNA